MNRRRPLSALLFALCVSRAAWACPFCNVDGMLSRDFILVVMGSALTAAGMFLGWSVARGHWHDAEAIKYRILELDAATTVRL